MSMVPGFWMYETSGVLRPAVEAYLNGHGMTQGQVLAMRAYLRQWIAGDFWGPRVEELRRDVEAIRSRADIDRWLRIAEEEMIDPL